MGDRLVGSDAAGVATQGSAHRGGPRARTTAIAGALVAAALFALMLPALAHAEGEEAPPAVLNQAPVVVGKTSAVLKALVDPNNAIVTECEFEWGTSPTELTETTPCEGSLPEGGENYQDVFASIVGLKESTKYYFRIVAVSEYGEGIGVPVKSFTTLPTRPTIVAGSATNVGKSAATLNGQVNPNDANVTRCEFLYSTSQNFESAARVPCANSPGGGEANVKVSAHATGLAERTTYYYRLEAENSHGAELGSVTHFRTPPREPTTSTEGASEIGRESATLNAVVNARGSEILTCEFEYGPTILYGTKVPCKSLPTGNGENAQNVSAEITKLAESTTYYYRIVVTNALGVATGGHKKFTTFPTVPKTATQGPSHVTDQSAQLNATVNPGAANVTLCEFEWGTSNAYGHRIPCASLPGSGETPVAVSALLTGLAPATTYDYRIVAGNSFGTTFGGNFKFTTPAEGPPVVTKLSPPKGWTGKKVTIKGSGFTLGTTTVLFGLVEATAVEVVSATKVVATVPEEAEGVVDVTVTTPNGTSAVTTSDRFLFKKPK
ncbi:MAG TPA: IPT/TIG domain-containing protein [Solirubrobacteraceae bacterium]|nr:IPT/TIG domain-containing protein [Solirubrobacteraceae bacterium]